MLLEKAIEDERDFSFETTLGGNTIPRLLKEASLQGMRIRIRFVGLASPELHIARVAARVAEGGHDIPTEKIRERYEKSRRNIIRLLPWLTELRVFDNSFEANPLSATPLPQLLVHYKDGLVLQPPKDAATPAWARDIVAAAFQQASVGRTTH